MAFSKDMQLRVVTPDRTVFDRRVRAVSFMGLDGSYGILPNHAPLLTATRPGIVTITHVDGTKEAMLVTDGFAEMRHNVLSLICEAGERAEEIDVERAKEAEERARKAIAEGATVTDESLPRAEAALRRAMLRQLVGRRGRSQQL
jgi:F-type H+-transporting ATPase subunit epsilon